MFSTYKTYVNSWPMFGARMPHFVHTTIISVILYLVLAPSGSLLICWSLSRHDRPMALLSAHFPNDVSDFSLFSHLRFFRFVLLGG